MATRTSPYDETLRAIQAQAGLRGSGSSAGERRSTTTRRRGEPPNQTRTPGAARKVTQAPKVRAPSPDEERATFGAPGSGGAQDPRFGAGGMSGNGFNLAGLFDELFGGGGEQGNLAGIIGDSYDAQIAALTGLGGELGGLTQNLIGNINSSAAATNDQIGGFFGYAADQAEAGRPVIQETGERAQANVDNIYDTLATNLGNIPAQAVNQASAAAGEQVGGSVAGRVAAATAPFAAAGETSRANAQANMTQHSAAGQDYLSQLSAAAPSEAALSQGAVSGRANMAVTEAEMALAQQRAEISAQAAALEGAKQRALLEASADTAGSTFERMMQSAQLYDALGADMGPLRDQLGMQAAPGDPTDALAERRAELDWMNDEADWAERQQGPTTGLEGFQAALSRTSPYVQNVANDILAAVEASSGGSFDPGLAMQLISQLVNDGSVEERDPAELLADPTAQGFTAADPDQLRDLFRILVAG